MHLRPARADEAALLTELCLRSKAVWGYDEAFLRACRAELSFRPADFADASVQVAVDGDEVLGVAQVKVAGETAELARLFIAPRRLRRGAGRILFGWAATEARSRGARWMRIESDPDAAPFYRRMGAIDDGIVPSGSIPGRMLPRLKLAL